MSENLEENSPVTPTNISLLAMLQDQRDVISMMQIQLDLQKERLDKQDELIQTLQLQVNQLTEASAGNVKEPELKGDTKARSSTTDRDWKPDESSRPSDTNNTSVADLVKEVADQVLAQQTDYIFDEKSGLYYDQNSGYYYDPVQALFYNGHTRTYYKWDAESKTYVFHSQLPEEGKKKQKKGDKKQKEGDNKQKEGDNKQKGGDKKQKIGERKMKPTAKKVKVDDSQDVSNGQSGMDHEMTPTSPVIRPAEMEDGELSNSSTTDETSEDDDDEEGSESDATITSLHSTSSTSSRVKEECLPCIRAVVMESPVAELTKGFLFLVTVMGGSIGREGNMHSILIADPHVSKHHADVHFSSEEGKFYLTDVGSQTGTFLNGRRLSDSRVTSEAEEVLHGSKIKIGATTLLIHIHPGSLTCAMCEPGLNAPAREPLYGPPVSKEKKEALRKKGLRKLRQKYCIDQGGTDALANVAGTYADRASERRKVKGSDNPYEKTEVATMDQSIKETNKGFQMLTKMGWKSGTSLGPADAATAGPAAREGGRLVEPIKVELLPQRVGLGFEKDETSETRSKRLPSPAVQTRQSVRRGMMLEKTLKRYNQGVSVADAGDGDNASLDNGSGSRNVPAKLD